MCVLDVHPPESVLDERLLDCLGTWPCPIVRAGSHAAPLAMRGLAMTLVDPSCGETSTAATDGLRASSRHATGDRGRKVRRYVCRMSSRRYTSSASALGGVHWVLINPGWLSFFSAGCHLASRDTPRIIPNAKAHVREEGSVVRLTHQWKNG